ncbi:MAG TPA: hypothetical protein VF498_09005, partial [Anaerolineales bacterium]
MPLWIILLLGGSLALAACAAKPAQPATPTPPPVPLALATPTAPYTPAVLPGATLPDTALSVTLSALNTALEVVAANGVAVRIQQG